MSRSTQPATRPGATFLWSYIYRVTVGDRLLTTLLAVCQADVVTMSDDEHARASRAGAGAGVGRRNRSTVETILRANGRSPRPMEETGSSGGRPCSSSNTRIVEAMTTDDDGDTISDAAAVVRSSTSQRGRSASDHGSPVYRFLGQSARERGIVSLFTRRASRHSTWWLQKSPGDRRVRRGRGIIHGLHRLHRFATRPDYWDRRQD